MKILYSNRTLYPFEGGADISALILLEHLSKNHEVSAVYIGDKLENPKIKSYPQSIKKKKGIWINTYFLNKQWVKILSDLVENEKPDLIICQDYLIPASIKVAKKFGIKTIAFLRSYVHISIDGFMTYLPEDKKPGKTSDLIHKLQYPFYSNVIKDFIWALKNTDLIICNSYYLSRITKDYYGVNSEVLRPFVPVDKYKVENKGDFITYVNPDIHKGVKIFEKIVEKMPDKKFLVAGKEGYKLDKPNVEVIGWIKDMKEVYAKTSLLLVPSIWPDTCPRVCIEVMQSGIPFVVSNRGGLTEEAEECGIVVYDIFNIDEWVNAIKKFDEKIFYNEMSKKAKKKSLDFEAKGQLKKFDLLLKNIFNK